MTDYSKQSLDNATTMKPTNPFLKQKSLSTMADSSKQSQLVNVDTSIRQRRSAIVGIVCGEKFFENSNDTSPKVHISSGSFFYGQVVAQQQLQATRNQTKNGGPFENICPDIKTQSTVSCAQQVRDYFKMSMQQVILLGFLCQVCVSLYLYYSIVTLKCYC